MSIPIVASECAPAVEIGRAVAVVFGVDREREIRRNAEEIILPRYHRMRHGAGPIVRAVGRLALNIDETVRRN